MTDEQQQQNRVFDVGDWRVDGNSLTVSRGDESRPIEPKAYQVLRYLSERPGELVTIDELMDTQWDGAVVTPNAVSRVIAQIRKVLDDDAKNPRYVETVSRNGYRFVATPAGVKVARARSRPKGLVGAGIAVALLAAIFFLWPTEPAEPSIAVLPFQNMTGDSDWDYVGDGVAEEVINSLSRIPGLRVRPQIQSFRFRDSDKSLAEIAEELDVTFIVAGSVRTNGQNTRLAAQLIDPVSGENLQSVTEEYGARQLFDGQDAVSRAVAAVVLAAADLPAFTFEVRKHQPDPEAYDLYLRGRHIWHRRGSEPLQPAIDYFREAVQIDPEFGRGWGALSMAYLTYPSYSPRGYATWSDAEPAAKKALELDPDIAEAYSVLGTFAQTRFEWTRSEELLLQGIQRNPQSATVNYWYAEFLEIVGKHADSITYLRRAMELDPTYRPPRLMFGVSHMNFGDYERASELMLEVWESGHSLMISSMLNFMIAVYNQDADTAEAWVNAGPADDATKALMIRFAVVHLRGEADATLIADIADHYWRRPDYLFGNWMLGQLGAHDRVFKQLNARLDAGRHLDSRGLWAPELETRNQPEFIALLNRLGLIEFWDSSGWGSICVQTADGVDCSGSGMTPELLQNLLAADQKNP